MYRILITGASGQLGREFQALAGRYQHHFFFATKDQLDITQSDTLLHYCKENSIDTIINCAAYTAVDQAEEDRDEAMKVNAYAPKMLAQIANDLCIRLIHISTDYVFDGRHFKPYLESDTTNPQTIYGISKRDGEAGILARNPKDSIIIRTSWVYSPFGNNFLKTMLTLGKTRESLSVIFDQIGTPTYARDLACAILEILPNITNDNTEIYHYSNEGVTSWFDFAREIMDMARFSCEISPIQSHEYQSKATRPHYCVLDKQKIKSHFALRIPHWKDSLHACIKRIKESENE